jgi:hypothetical protein
MIDWHRDPGTETPRGLNANENMLIKLNYGKSLGIPPSNTSLYFSAVFIII